METFYGEYIEYLGGNSNLARGSKNRVNNPELKQLQDKKAKEIFDTLNKVHNPKIVSKRTIVRLFRFGIIKEEYLTHKTWPVFAKEFNLVKRNLLDYSGKLPETFSLLFKLLGGEKGINDKKGFILSELKPKSRKRSKN